MLMPSHKKNAVGIREEARTRSIAGVIDASWRAKREERPRERQIYYSWN